MKQKVLSLILATMLAMTVVACGGTEDVVGTDSQTEDNVIEESVEAESEVVETESETESAEETIAEDVHDASADSIAHTEELVGEITCDSGDFTIGVKMLDGYEVLYWRIDEFGSQQYTLQNDTYKIYYRLLEGNIDEMYATDFEQVYDPYDNDNYLLDEVVVFETGDSKNDDSKSVYYLVRNSEFSPEQFYSWIVLYFQVDEKHYVELEVDTVAMDEKGYVLDINEFIDLTKECYFVIE